jgi:hypothetical protein
MYSNQLSNGHRYLKGFEVVMIQLGESMGADLIVAELQGPLCIELIRQAAFRLQQRHPGLRASVCWPEGRRRRPRFEYHEPNLERLTVEEVGEDWSAADLADQRPPWQQIAERETARPFAPEHGFMFRVTWVPSPSSTGGHLICAAHHAIVDGTSLMRLLDQLLAACAELYALADEAEPAAYIAAARNLPAVVPLPPTPSVVDHLRFNPLEKLAIKLARRQFLREQRAFVRHCPLPVQGALSTGKRMSTLCTFRSGEAVSWSAIQAQCRDRGVTVGGAFSAAVQYSVLRHLTRSRGPLALRNGRIRLPLSMDYNMRTRLDRPNSNGESLGLYTGLADIGIEVPASIDFWELASRLMVSARKRAKQRMPTLFQGLADGLFDYPEFLRRGGVDHHPVGGVGDCINISNVGRYPFAQARGPFQLQNVFGLNGACLSGPMFIFWLRHVNDHLCYNAIAASPASNREILEAIFKDLVDLMESSGKSAVSKLPLGRYLETSIQGDSPEQWSRVAT